MPWDNTIESITSVTVIDEGITPIYTNSWFRSFTMCESFELSKLDTSKVTDMVRMFNYCPKLKTLDLSGFDTSNVTNMSGMFWNCSNLSTIYVGDGWNVSNVTSSGSMFDNCTKLPNYNSSVEDKTNAHYGEGGYLTYKAS